MLPVSPEINVYAMLVWQARPVCNPAAADDGGDEEMRPAKEQGSGGHATSTLPAEQTDSVAVFCVVGLH